MNKKYCACGHPEDLHEETMIGCLCKGREHDEQGHRGKPCQCDGFRPKDPQSKTS